MKNLLTWLLYGVGAVSLGYLALYAYAVWRGDPLRPGDPIQIFRRPDAPSYSHRKAPVDSAAPRFLYAARSQAVRPPRSMAG